MCPQFLSPVSIGVDIVWSCAVREVETDVGIMRYENSAGYQTRHWDHLLLATDPQTAACLTGDSSLIDHTGKERVLGTAGKES